MLTLIALSAALLQDPPAPPPRETYTRVLVVGPDGPGSLDKDGDGQVSRDEFSAPMNDHFARIDADGDGRLSTAELSAGHGPSGDGDVMVFHGGPEGGPGARRFEMRRPGGPGAGTRQEHQIVVRTPDGSGGPMVIHGPVHGAPGGESRFEIRHAGGPGGHADMDKDADGRISEAEFTAPLRDAFARMDADRSGFIEDAEQGGGRDVQVLTRRLDVAGGDKD
ncbi:MAG: hypothetical protein ACK4JY_05410 [Brevundimonas sp.]|uniref:hypothetical protein n=1 Tax=Brevundimonas sp. TaxID=1871086 RepID=UPI00391AE257